MKVTSVPPVGNVACKGLTIEARFTQGKGPFEGIEWESRTASVKEDGGKSVFEMKDVRVPSSWSQLATDILASKYCRKAEVPASCGGGDEKGQEHDAERVVTRLALAVRSSGVKQGGYFATDDDAQRFQDELSWLLIRQVVAFNSPVWFNLGLAEAYGIKGDPAGTFHFNPGVKDVVPSQDGYTRPQVSACFIRGVQDDLNHIMRGVGEEARLFKFGSGVGSNFSALRAEGEPLRNGGTSSGLMSWLEIYDRAAGAIKSGGTTRRAAKMVILDADHPDVFKFVEWKAREEDKARALCGAGFGMLGDINSEALRTVSGQNANNSVRVTDVYMRAVQSDAEWSTTWRTSGAVAETFKARKLWDKIAEAAWKCADPGLQFHDTINRWHTCSNTAPIKGSNPCTEFMFLDDTSCNLASLNLVKFLKSDGSFALADFMHAVRVLFLAMEILVDHASYPSEAIAQNSHDYRPLGIGYANLGALLMRKGLPYDSREGRALAAAVTSLMTARAYETSAEVAASKGPFNGFDRNREPMLAVMKRHAMATGRIDTDWGSGGCIGLVDVAQKTWASAIEQGKTFGYRNSQASAIAPTGTIGLLMDCDTTGIEPDLALVKHKKLAGGGSVTIANQSVGPALKSLGYSEQEVSECLSYLGAKFKLPELRDGHAAVFACSLGENAISPMGHVAMMEAVQPFISGAISKTVNMPKGSTVEDVAAIYEESWKRGLKAIAIYRDGSKSAQPLGDKKDAGSKAVGRKPLPKKRHGFTHKLKIGGQKFYLRTGEYPDGTIGEIFIDIHKEGSTMRALANAFAVAVSVGLQYGVPLEEYVKAYVRTQFEPRGVVDHDRVKVSSSILDAMFRVLAIDYLGMDELANAPGQPVAEKVQEDMPTWVKKAITIESDAPLCRECGHVMKHKTGSCHVCDNCGTSAGCS